MTEVAPELSVQLLSAVCLPACGRGRTPAWFRERAGGGGGAARAGWARARLWAGRPPWLSWRRATGGFPSPAQGASRGAEGGGRFRAPGGRPPVLGWVEEPVRLPSVLLGLHAPLVRVCFVPPSGRILFLPSAIVGHCNVLDGSRSVVLVSMLFLVMFQIDLSSGICQQGISWQHVHRPCVTGRVYYVARAPVGVVRQSLSVSSASGGWNSCANLLLLACHCLHSEAILS